MRTLIIWVAAIQAVYYFLTGVWPLVSIRTFMKVTGPKNDLWLVQTVGVLIIVIACTLGVASIRGNMQAEVAVLGIGSAAALAGVDTLFVARRIIPPIYLLDAVAEGVLIAGWAWGLAARG